MNAWTNEPPRVSGGFYWWRLNEGWVAKPAWCGVLGATLFGETKARRYEDIGGEWSNKEIERAGVLYRPLLSRERIHAN